MILGGLIGEIAMLQQSFAQGLHQRSASAKKPLASYRAGGFFTRFVWLATHRHCPSDKIQVSVNRP